MLNLVTMSAKVQVYQLVFNPLDYSHIGGYTCQANLTVSSIKEPFIGKGSNTTIVNVQGICFSMQCSVIIIFGLAALERGRRELCT